MGQRAMSTLAVIALCLGCTGCTLIGMGIGSAVPVYEPTRPAWEIEDAQAGTEVRLRMADGRRIEGMVQSQPDPLVVRDSDTGKRVAIDPASVWVAEKKVGTEWATGTLIGAAVDVTVLLVGAAILAYAPHFSGPMNFSLGPGP